jgi:hypothetical protein
MYAILHALEAQHLLECPICNGADEAACADSNSPGGRALDDQLPGTDAADLDDGDSTRRLWARRRRSDNGCRLG